MRHMRFLSSFQPATSHHFGTSNFGVHWPISTRSEKRRGPKDNLIPTYYIKIDDMLLEDSPNQCPPNKNRDCSMSVIILYFMLTAARQSNLTPLASNDSIRSLLAVPQLGDKG